MSAPTAPPVIRIKRKRDDAPLEALYLEGGLAKRRVTEDIYVFRRFLRESEPRPPVPVGEDGIPTVRVTQPGEEKRDPWALKKVETPQKPISTVSSTPRRFHLSRPATPSFSSPANKRVRKSEVATFIERRGVAEGSHNELGSDKKATGILEDGIVVGLPTRKLKRPSARVRVAVPFTLDSNNKTGGQNTAGQHDPDMLSQMAAWADATDEAEKNKDISTSGKTQVHNKPLNTSSAGETDDGVEDMDIDNEGDYVYDTYVRHLVPADTAMPESTDGLVGHLVIPEEHQELWETYIEEEDGADDREFDTDDEDSNAEDYYGADYPEDEVAEDDEYGQGAYEEYRNAASDEEEWGDRGDDEVFGSDTESLGGPTEFARGVRTRAKDNVAAGMQRDGVGGEETSEMSE